MNPDLLCLLYREFFYIQMEKYSRQALAEGVKNVSDLVVSADCELFRVLVLHYNRNNQIEVCCCCLPTKLCDENLLIGVKLISASAITDTTLRQ